MPRLRCWIAGLLAVLPMGAAQAWHAAGHSATGAIAFLALKNSPDVRLRVQQTLMGNRDLSAKVAESLQTLSLPSTGMERGEFVFSRAATWPDEIRSNPALSVPDEHYVNLQFTPPHTGTHQLSPKPTDILRAFQRHVARLKQPKRPGDTNDANERGIALAWIFHLVGDIHQPLHTIALVTDDYPAGDLGGNAFIVTPPQGFEDQGNLHSFWDGFWDRSWSKPRFDPQRQAYVPDDLPAPVQFKNIHQLSGMLMARHPVTSSEFTSELPVTDFRAWCDRSFYLAQQFAYRENGQLLPPGKKDHPTPLSPTYCKTALQTAEPRMVLAGYRLAQLLRSLAPNL